MSDEDQTDQTVPPGWEISYLEPGPRIVSRCGEIFSSRREAFQWLCREERTVEERAEMFDKLVYEDFQASERLPLGWIFRPTEAEINFLSSSGLYISSVREAERYFRDREYQQFQEFLSTQPGLAEGWTEDPRLPAGWRWRLVENRPQFVSREGERLDSPAEAVAFLSRNSPPYEVRPPSY